MTDDLLQIFQRLTAVETKLEAVRIALGHLPCELHADLIRSNLLHLARIKVVYGVLGFIAGTALPLGMRLMEWQLGRGGQ